MLILALECSTTSAKTMLFDADAGLVEVQERRLTVPGGDSAVRDGDDIVAQVLDLGRDAAAGRPVDLIALSGTWHGLTLRTPELEAVTPVLEWPYTGARELTARLRRDDDFARWFHGRTGCLVNASYPAFKLRHLRDAGQDLSGLVAMDQPTVLFARLTGEISTNASLASGTGLLGVATGEWDAEVVDRLGLGDVELPAVRAATATAPLTPHAAARLGLRAGIPVLTPGPDGGLSQVGDLATEPGDMTFSMGTSGALRMATRHPALSPTLSTWAYRSPLGPLSGAATSGCGNCVDWARDRLFGADVPYRELEPLLSAERTDLPVFLPFLFGERSPGWQDGRRGGLLDLQPHHTRADMYQGVLEGIVYSLYHCYTELTPLTGAPRRIVLSGGVLSSPMWTQLTVDVFGVAMELSPRRHSSLVGAVRMGLRASGLSGRHAAFDDVAPVVVSPRTERRAQYDAGFARYLDRYARTGAEA
ncbi:FGGY-family carbohydrate kinase [Microbacterium sp. zg.Y1090]|uniref:gluconokinase n=1 Tax=Microbacterium TaxID=33882 RepID=UPI00214AD02E|nr:MULTISPECIES: FGGY-family carbohydrate kinase [unclassified Microbacterium]MCR2812199.1 FGGY-family carbohydrate kinase [Microbacterium sp. zg.Y1084]MCR2818363.1 FGGY-family carbohydrate kinase [Microbacterium sp. zg.Y1090]MDL5486175.1 FGGY-family carbohydrate kinase [Microbacterium sp. zg-Y1211]WIM29382.1 FGGY-family carbohydrate kinase [Microbacterium sp. zg-Y1090]